MPSFISSDVAEDIILFAKHIFDQKKIRKSFNNDNQYEVPQKHSSYPITLTFTKERLVKCKKRECLNYNTYGVCGHTLAVSACTSSLTIFPQSLQKNRHNIDLLELSNFGNPSGSGTKKGYKRVRSKSIFDKGVKKIKSANRSIIWPISSLELAKCKSLIKFNNQPENSIGQSLGPKAPLPEPQLQPYELIKRCKQVSKCNGGGFSFDKTHEKLYILGRNELKCYGKVATTTKQHKIGQRNTYYCAKRRYILIRRPHLDIKEIKIITKSDVPEDIKMGIETEFGVKLVEHKELL